MKLSDIKIFRFLFFCPKLARDEHKITRISQEEEKNTGKNILKHIFICNLYQLLILFYIECAVLLIAYKSS